jgi:exonuclease SbcC
MIITHLLAENVLKYQRLELADLPHKGVIAISGPNESGKSTIGETVCFALFGRTFSIDEAGIDRVIRWGENRCSVRLRFIAGDAEYEIARFLDSEGNHGVRLYPAGDEDHLLAKGVSGVSEELYRLLGYQYEEFVESFYLAQREITTPHPHSHAVKTMAGISALEKVAEEFAVEVRDEQARMPDLHEQINNVSEDIEALALDQDVLPTLERQIDDEKLAVAGLRARQGALQQGLNEYREAQPQLYGARSRKRFMGLLTLLFLVLALLSAAGWYLLGQMPEAPLSLRLRDSLSAYMRYLDGHGLQQLAIVAGVSVLAALVFWWQTRRFASKQREQASKGELLAGQLSEIGDLPVYSQVVQEPAPGPAAGADAAEQAEHAEAPAMRYSSLSERLDPSNIAALRELSLSFENTAELVESARSKLDDLLTSRQYRVDELARTIRHEQSRHARAQALREMLDSLNQKVARLQHDIDLRLMADELLKGSARHVSQRFNRDLRQLASGTLPLFTGQRYEHVQIDEALNVRVFSSQKHDFMDLDEISSGTQRQIMLAVRLALSQELVNTTTGGPQFVFLDEPFAFFDQERTRNSMAVLPRLSDELTQIWVIAQEFPPGTEFDRAIECDRDYDSIPPHSVD